MGALRQAVRTMMRSRVATTLAALTFGIGVASTTAMFSVVHGVMVQPLPYPNANRIYDVFKTTPAGRSDPVRARVWDRLTFSWPEYQALRARQQAFVEVGGWSGAVTFVTAGSATERLRVGLATPSLFTVLGVRPALGRLLTEEDDRRVSRTALVTHDFWTSRLAGDSASVGTTIDLNGRPYTVVGVLPQGFRFEGYDAPVWMALAGPPDGGLMGLDNDFVSVVGLLKRGAAAEAAAQEVRTVLPPDESARVVPRLRTLTERARSPLLLLFGACGLLFVVSCVSVTAIVMGNVADRDGEFAVRRAIGAGSGRLVAQLLAESGVLAVLGGAAGLLLAPILLKGLLGIAPAGLPRLDDVRIDGPTLLFTLGGTALCTIVSGLLPMVSSPGERALRMTRSTNRRGRLHRGLIIGEVALATVLLVGAGLLARTMGRLDDIDPGFRPEGVVAVRMMPIGYRLDESGRGGTGMPTLRVALDQMLERARSLPGVTTAALAEVLPYSADGGANEIAPSGASPAFKPIVVDRRTVSSSYFEALGVPILRGRAFTDEEDRIGGPAVALVSEHVARQLWPGGDALGKRFSWEGVDREVVGITGDLREFDLTDEERGEFYVPFRQVEPWTGRVLVRTDGDETRLAEQLREVLAADDPPLLIQSVEPLRDQIRASEAERRFRARLLIVFGIAATLIALAGIHGVIGRSVIRRRHEMAVRLALGSDVSQVVARVLNQGLILTGIGVALGGVLALPSTRVLQSPLYGVGRADPITYGFVTLVFAATAVFACLRPALSVARVEPMRVLRSE